MIIHRLIFIITFLVFFTVSCQQGEKAPSVSEKQYEKEMMENAIDSVPESLIINPPSDSIQ
jgi:PBP1b-binding outer membrane lipoprotein LpoB